METGAVEIPAREIHQEKEGGEEIETWIFQREAALRRESDDARGMQSAPEEGRYDAFLGCE